MTSSIVVTTTELSPEQNGVEESNNDFDDRLAATEGAIAKSKLKSGSRKKARKVGGLTVDDDFDDNASVSSSMSSASEHSVKSDTKIKKTKRLHCDVHSKSSKTKGKDNHLKVESSDHAVIGSGGVDTTSDGKESVESSGEPKCTCRKNVKNKSSGKSKVTRPEPEGSLLSDPSKLSFLDDLERVIYGSDPLFSEAEDEDPSLEDQIRAESERFHRRIIDPENIFSAVQMLNTNTMMKLAIIQTELKNVKDVSLRRSEGEIVSAAKRAEVLRETFEHTENSFKSYTSQLSEASKAIGPLLDSQQSSAQSGRGSADDRRQILPLDKEQQRMGAAADVISKRRSLYGKRLVNEVDLEIVQCSLEVAEMKICELEEEQMVISNARKSRNTSEFEELIRRLSQQQAQADKQAREAEQAILCLGKQLKDLQEERSAEKKKYKPISAEMKATFAELCIF